MVASALMVGDGALMVGDGAKGEGGVSSGFMFVVVGSV